jgi:hypothetical protein
MSFGTRFRTKPGATSSLKATAGAMLIGAALVGGSLGAAVAQDATPPSASPEASPVAVAAWINDIMVEEFPEPDADSTTVGVKVNDTAAVPLTILGNPTAAAPDNVPTFETRPYVILQVANANEQDFVVVILEAPEGFSAAGMTLPDDVAGLPEGVTPVAAFEVGAMETVDAVFADMAPGTYVLATTSGLAQAFVVNEQAEIEVPDIFASPEATP